MKIKLIPFLIGCILFVCCLGSQYLGIINNTLSEPYKLNNAIAWTPNNKTLRDQFATSAMNALIMREGPHVLVPKEAYEMADVMMERRNK